MADDNLGDLEGKIRENITDKIATITKNPMEEALSKLVDMKGILAECSAVEHDATAQSPIDMLTKTNCKNIKAELAKRER